MNIIKSLVAATVLAGAAVAVPATAATLIGDTVTTTLAVGSVTYASQSDVVGAGDEGNLFGNQFYDYGATTFTIRSTSAFSGGVDSTNNIVALTLSSLDFGTPITNVTFTTSLTGVTRTFTANSVTFNWVNQPIPASTYLSAAFVTASAVPEPATWGMMIVGFGMIGAASRSRKVKTTVSFA